MKILIFFLIFSLLPVSSTAMQGHIELDYNLIPQERSQDRGNWDGRLYYYFAVG